MFNTLAITLVTSCGGAGVKQMYKVITGEVSPNCLILDTAHSLTTTTAGSTTTSSTSASSSAGHSSAMSESDPDIEYLGMNLGSQRGSDSDIEQRCYAFLESCTQDAFLPHAREAFDAFSLALCERLERPLTDGELIACAWCAHAAQHFGSTAKTLHHARTLSTLRPLPFARVLSTVRVHLTVISVSLLPPVASYPCTRCAQEGLECLLLRPHANAKECKCAGCALGRVPEGGCRPGERRAAVAKLRSFKSADLSMGCNVKEPKSKWDARAELDTFVRDSLSRRGPGEVTQVQIPESASWSEPRERAAETQAPADTRRASLVLLFLVSSLVFMKALIFAGMDVPAYQLPSVLRARFQALLVESMTPSSVAWKSSVSVAPQ